MAKKKKVAGRMAGEAVSKRTVVSESVLLSHGWLKVFVGVGVVLLLGLLLIPAYKREAGVVPDPSADPTGAQDGDVVSVDFVLRLEDGVVVDTNNPVLAKEAGLSTYAVGPYRLIVGKSGKVEGFDDALKGLHAGESRKGSILPSQPVTRIVINRTQEKWRNEPIPRISFLSKDEFVKRFSKPPIVGDVVVSSGVSFRLQVRNVSENRVALSMIVKEGESVQLPGLPWKSTVLGVYEHQVTVRHNPESGMVVDSVFGPASVSVDGGVYAVHYSAVVGQLVNYSVSSEMLGKGAGLQASVHTKPGQELTFKHRFKITEVTDDFIVIERDDNLAEKKLLFEFKVLDLVKKE